MSCSYFQLEPTTRAKCRLPRCKSPHLVPCICLVIPTIVFVVLLGVYLGQRKYERPHYQSAACGIDNCSLVMEVCPDETLGCYTAHLVLVLTLENVTYTRNITVYDLTSKDICLGPHLGCYYRPDRVAESLRLYKPKATNGGYIFGLIFSGGLMVIAGCFWFTMCICCP